MSILAIFIVVMVVGAALVFRSALFPSMFPKKEGQKTAVSQTELKPDTSTANAGLTGTVKENPDAPSPSPSQSKSDSESESNASPSSSDGNANAKALEQRPCLVLKDSIKSTSTSGELLNTGETFWVNRIEGDSGAPARYWGRWNHSADTGAIDAGACLLFDDQDLFSNFLFSTAENSEVMDRALVNLDPNSGKAAALKTGAFYARVLGNPNAGEQVDWAIDNWMRYVDADALAKSLLALANSPLVNADRVGEKVGTHFDEKPPLAEKMIRQFRLLPVTEKLRLAEIFPAALAAKPTALPVLRDALGKGASPEYLSAALECLKHMPEDAKNDLKSKIQTDRAFKSASPAIQKRVLASFPE